MVLQHPLADLFHQRLNVGRRRIGIGGDEVCMTSAHFPPPIRSPLQPASSIRARPRQATRQPMDCGRRIRRLVGHGLARLLGREMSLTAPQLHRVLRFE